MEIDLPLPPALAAKARLGYPVFTGEDNVNLWGIRMGVDSPQDLPKIDDKWNDYIGCSWQDANGYWHERVFAGTTDPGVKYIDRPLNANGTAVLVPDHYPSAYVLGEHKGRPALVQRGRSGVRIWRLDRDGLREKGAFTGWGPRNRSGRERQFEWQTYVGWFGLNIHDGVGAGDLIGPFSAGCQVIPGQRADNSAQLNDILEVCRRSERRYGKYFSYTLMTEGQVFGTPAPNTAPNQP